MAVSSEMEVPSGANGSLRYAAVVRLRSIARLWRHWLAWRNSRLDRSPLRSLQDLQLSPLFHCENAARRSDHFADVLNKFSRCNREIIQLFLIGHLV